MVRGFFPFRKFLTTNCNSFVNFGRLPFDWRNPLLYTILFCTLYIEFILATHFIACVASIFAGLCVMLITFAKDLKQDLCSFQLADGAENSSEFQVKLCQFVEFHSNVKQLSHNCDRKVATNKVQTKEKYFYSDVKGIGSKRFGMEEEEKKLENNFFSVSTKTLKTQEFFSF